MNKDFKPVDFDGFEVRLRMNKDFRPVDFDGSEVKSGENVFTMSMAKTQLIKG